MAQGQLDAFDVNGEWWHADGQELLEQSPLAGDQPAKLGLDDGMGLFQTEEARKQGSDEHHACPGPLRFDPEGALRLTLLGASQVVFASQGDRFTMHGYTSNGAPCSLLGCMVGKSSVNSARGFAENEVTAHTFVRGAHVGGPEELVFDRAQLTIEGLRDFLTHPAYDKEEHPTPGLDSGGELAEHLVSLEGGRVTFQLGVRRSRTPHSETRERDAAVTIELDEPRPFDDWTDAWVNPVLRLVQFGTREPVRLASFTVLRGEGTESVEVIRPAGTLLLRPRADYRRVLVSYAVLGDDVDGFVQRWWQLHQALGGAADFLFGGLAGRMTLEPRLMTFASVAESYQRALLDEGPPMDEKRHEELTSQMLAVLDDPNEAKVYERKLGWANEHTLEERLRAMVRRAGPVVGPLGEKSGRLSTALAATRNYFAHLSVKRPEVLDGSAEMYEATYLLLLTLDCNLLLDLGFEAERATALIERSYGQESLWWRLQERGDAWPKDSK